MGWLNFFDWWSSFRAKMPGMVEKIVPPVEELNQLYPLIALGTGGGWSSSRKGSFSWASHHPSQEEGIENTDIDRLDRHTRQTDKQTDRQTDGPKIFNNIEQVYRSPAGAAGAHSVKGLSSLVGDQFGVEIIVLSISSLLSQHWEP